ncbi:MAG: hypothetical protein ACREQ5_09745 [Candidatus Dormibacteria bacterium]
MNEEPKKQLANLARSEQEQCLERLAEELGFRNPDALTGMNPELLDVPKY